MQQNLIHFIKPIRSIVNICTDIGYRNFLIGSLLCDKKEYIRWKFGMKKVDNKWFYRIYFLNNNSGSNMFECKVWTCFNKNLNESKQFKILNSKFSKIWLVFSFKQRGSLRFLKSERIKISRIYQAWLCANRFTVSYCIFLAC